MLITPEKIEKWKKDPAQWDYDRGYNEGSIDAYTQFKPKVFTIEHSKSFRLGYRQGWADQKTHLLTENMHRNICGQNNSWECALCEKLYREVCEQTQKTAEVQDDDVPGYSEDDWKQAMNFLEHPEEMKVKRRVYHKNGMIIREDYD